MVARDVWKSRRRVLMATVTMVVSRTDMIDPSTTTKATLRTAGSRPEWLPCRSILLPLCPGGLHCRDRHHLGSVQRGDAMLVIAHLGQHCCRVLPEQARAASTRGRTRESHERR